ncbi:hypothetical protein AOQ84DRAFT_376655 [Glonium stellatum]|uniref:Uncharacterized protein n=1 Tax=Glonium stellatum TaxID=574774 RepID=A0A8E2F107_9PEZI|nr:hypothetical protein AOQ84DRAFT_376655 [Glonium stellatum]
MDKSNEDRLKRLISSASTDETNESSPDFIFVTTTDPTKGSDRSTRRRIHQHAMNRIGKSRRTRPRLVQLTFNVRSPENSGIAARQPQPSQHPDAHSRNIEDVRAPNLAKESTPQEMTLVNTFPGPVTLLGAGPGVDPFNAYPVPMARGDHALIYHRKSTHPSDSSPDSFRHFQLSAISIPYISGDLERWRFHIEGLERIIKLRGGIDTLNSDRAVRLMVFWIDITGSLVTDSAPLFPIPQAFIPPLRSLQTKEPSPVLSRLATHWRITCHASSDIMDVFLDLHRLTTLLSPYSTTQQGDIWQDELFVGLIANPVIHMLLALPRFIEADERAFALREACRVGAMLFVGCLRQQFDCYPDAVRPHKQQLRQLLRQSNGDDWGDLYELWIWLCVLEGLVAEEGEEMEEVVASLREIMGKAVLSWEEVLETAEAVLWIDRVFGARTEGLKQKVVTASDLQI